MTELTGKRVLVVEDELLLALDLEDMLTAAGCAVVGPAMRVEAAIELARDEAIEAAVLDININGARSYPIAEILRSRGIPFVFASGYGQPEGTSRFADVPTLPKPYCEAQVTGALKALLKPARDIEPA